MNISVTKLIFKDIFKLILAIFVIEVFSLISFKFSILSAIFFILIAIGVLLFTLYKLEYGLWICLAELMIGSQGYLFYLDLPNFKVSMRLGIFLIVFFVWLIKYFNSSNFFNLLKKDHLIQTFFLFLGFIALGFINGLVHNNGIKNVFFDFNGYLYFGLFFVFLEVFKSKRQVENLLKIFLAALSYVSLKIFFTLYLFSHNIPYLTDYFYHWIRDTRVGEITYAGANFFRIFFQSQIWSLIGIFVVILFLISIINRRSDLRITSSVSDKKIFYFFILLIILETSILISFSRSFWLGGLAGLGGLAVILLSAKLSMKKLAQVFGVLLGSGILSLLLLFCIANFPIPKPSAEFTAQLLGGRLFSFYGEAGVSSRWNQLPVLINKIKESPIIGSGFGTSVTYQSNDPRIKTDENPEGWYTTYTFEWGYLDTITEIGILGLLIYLILIGQILYSGYLCVKDNKLKFITTGFLLGLTALIITNIFSPYLNHPLGIGYLMLCSGIFQATNLTNSDR